MGLSTAEIMQLSLDLVGWESVPGDSAVHVPADDVETALVGIDMGSAEVQLAHREGYDLALAHHPAGGDARLRFGDVLDRQVELMVDAGVDPGRAESAVADLREDAAHRAHASNYRHDPSVAELLGHPFMNVHLAPDELGRRAFVEVADELPDGSTVGDLADAFAAAFPAIREAKTDVETRVGSEDDPLGTVAVHHGAGTNGGAPVAEAYFEAGVDTVVYIHVGSADTRELRGSVEEGKSLVVTGHIASDAVGLGRFVEALEAEGVACTPFSGVDLAV